MSEYRIDDLVDITIKGVRITRPRTAVAVTITDKHGVVYQMPPQAIVTRVAPENWPPRPGDLWRDRENRLWFAVAGLMSEGGKTELTCNGRNLRPPADILDLYAPLTRVHREDVTCADSECGHHQQLHHGNQCIGGNANDAPCPCARFRHGASS